MPIFQTLLQVTACSYIILLIDYNILNMKKKNQPGN